MSATQAVRKFGPLAQQVGEEAHDRDLDSKILITSHNSKPGLGKTTLGIKLARALDRNGWNAEEKAFLDPHDYMQAYDEVPRGSVLIIDELEASADNRRSNSGVNVDLSHAWATKRYRNIISIGTLPTTSMLDSRMVELSDYRINVLRRGAAKAFEIKIPDFPPHRPWQEPMDGVIDFTDLPDDDPDKRHLDDLKVEFTQVGKSWYTEREYQRMQKRVERETEKQTRDELLRKFYTNFDVTQKALAEAVAELSQGQVNKILNDA